MLFQVGPRGESVEIVSRSRLTRSKAREMVIKEMMIMRSMGYTDSEIALKYRLRRETVNRWINSAPEHVKVQLEEFGLV